MANGASVVLAVEEAHRLLDTGPSAAEARAREILVGSPAEPGALWVLGAALRRQQRLDEARAVLEPLVAAQPDMVGANFELGAVFGEMGERNRAIFYLEAAVDLHPRFAEAWCALNEQIAPADTRSEVSLREARAAINAGRRADAAASLSALVLREPDNAVARFLNAVLLIAFDRGIAAAKESRRLVEREPDNRHWRAFHAWALQASEDFAGAASEYESLLARFPDRPGMWMSYGRSLRALGRNEEAVAAFRKALSILAAYGEAWRTLASVNGFRFAEEERERMRALLARGDVRPSNRSQLLYALAKAEEDAGNFAEAFARYGSSNALQKASNPFDAAGPTGFVRYSKLIYMPEFFAARAGAGSPAREPIFIVGLPRSGTTLVEQIVSGHPAVEGMEELAFMGLTAARVAKTKPGQTIDAYLADVPLVRRDRFRELGEYYLGMARSRRTSTRPFFTDKMPNNFLHIGLIHLVLPNARIVDVRRNPLDCCMSCFSSYFVFPQPFAHSLYDLGRYYAEYVALMDHYDRVLPGRVHRVIYDDLVRHPEPEIRKLLASLGLPFDERCLRFYENRRSVRTLSAEQVRRPMYVESVGAWRRYEPWLDPLKTALGGVVESWRGIAREN